MSGLSENSSVGARDIKATLLALAKMPLATFPWWKSLMVMSENKGVFGLNMLKWWDREGSLERVTEPLLADLEAGLLEPVVARPFPSRGLARRTSSSRSDEMSARWCWCRPDLDATPGSR